jgi:predicted nucleotidyltransferase
MAPDDQPPALIQCLQAVGLDPAQVPALLAAEQFSRRQLELARACLAPSRPSHEPGAMAVFAFGSLGRLEASTQSDLDLAFLYDGARLDREQAEARRREVVERLRGELALPIPEKTFDQAIDLRALTRNIGGRLDTNETLTYRALLLTEGAWLDDAESGRAMKEAVFSAYADAMISRGRFLGSLGNDLHRYYRTLCMDYRHKVEELDKSWAIRVVKLRHSRKLWHLANLALQCWLVDAIADDRARDLHLAARIGWPSLVRLYGALEHFGSPRLCAKAFECHDTFLAALARPDVRDALAELDYEGREDSEIYLSLRENADRFDEACAAIVELLFARCRRFMVRFCIL